MNKQQGFFLEPQGSLKKDRADDDCRRLRDENKKGTETNMNINNPTFHAPVTVNEYNQTVDLAQLRQIIADKAGENQELMKALERLADAMEEGNTAAAKKNASSIMESIGGGTLANVLGSGVLALIRSLAGK